MSTYRITRNIEASVVDYIVAQLTADSWSGIRVELDFSEAYKEPLGCIVINADENPDQRLEIGGNTLQKIFNLEFRIFAENHGQRKDLRDWLLLKLMAGIPYYTYIITSGVVTTKTLSGRISIGKILINRKELANSEKQSKFDRYRHLITVQAKVALT